jgi:hypothetical protein
VTGLQLPLPTVVSERIKFSAMSKVNNEMIAEEEAGKRPKSYITLKNTFRLQDYYKTTSNAMQIDT